MRCGSDCSTWQHQAPAGRSPLRRHLSKPRSRLFAPSDQASGTIRIARFIRSYGLSLWLVAAWICIVQSSCHRGKKKRHGLSAVGRERPQETFGRLGREKVGFYKRGCQEKTLLHPQERNQISDIPLRPSDCNTICCVPRNFSLHVAGRSRRHSGTCKQRGSIKGDVKKKHFSIRRKGTKFLTSRSGPATA